MYVYSSHDALWRPLVFEKFGGDFRFRNSWKQSYLDLSREAALRKCPTTKSVTTVTTTTSVKGATTSVESNVETLHPITNFTTITPIAVKGVYSDELFQPWFCAAMGVDESWLTVENIPRVNNLPLEDFVEKFEAPNLPVIITDVVGAWPGYKKWSEEHLCKEYGNVKFRAGPIDITMSNYYRIKDTDENPIYLFDKFFGTNAPGLVDDYIVPPYFSGSQDLFSLFGDESRPDYKWIIIGPAGSGSTFHIDPNGTSAWNAVVKGRKKWIMYPPSVPPPGIFPSEDGSEVAAPVSLNEWFSKFYAESKKEGVKPFECIVNEGEMIFVPSGWWHAVVNIEDSIAITQNYVSNANLIKVIDFLKNKPNQISGCKPSLPAEELYARFTQEYDKVYPGKLEHLCEENRIRLVERAKGSFWNQVKNAAPVATENGVGNTSGGFSFGF
ncbi:hypothetical protein SARC_12239 [Sphaeroforma arctica JP610]|uniref:JmjC domain-containing protein n=1 Tax=Sphaeroforma arctica JP610 TaxID=667725 RepID=A0A0L0FEP0_9EUKA|nr:hypothetical protein SARC_12239 [Sphaeroforma arctica JP610]KNC75234.1 hypothetical protein SARC_12239 [Sphaeroforma arctica JP610]|eukprot:XP_014149136.1 hypothetical protein SARC_12239 [Sphaeroforma arctica JP610]